MTVPCPASCTLHASWTAWMQQHRAAAAAMMMGWEGQASRLAAALLPQRDELVQPATVPPYLLFRYGCQCRYCSSASVH